MNSENGFFSLQFKKYIETVFTTSSGQNSLKQIFDLGRFDVTIFAPTNEAFAQQHQLPETAWRYFSDPKDPNNKEFIKRYLNYHISEYYLVSR